MLRHAEKKDKSSAADPADIIEMVSLGSTSLLFAIGLMCTYIAGDDGAVHGALGVVMVAVTV